MSNTNSNNNSLGHFFNRRPNLSRRANRAAHLVKTRQERNMNTIYGKNRLNFTFTTQQSNIDSLKNRGGILGFFNSVMRNRRARANLRNLTRRTRKPNLSRFGI